MNIFLRLQMIAKYIQLSILACILNETKQFVVSSSYKYRYNRKISQLDFIIIYKYIPLGQFWNIPVNVTSYHTELPEVVRDYYNPENLFLVTVDNPISTRDPRQFIGELLSRSWDSSPISCLYVGNSQGGRLRDIPGPRDSVIEGRYTDYRVSDGLLGIDFMYSQFDTDMCY